MKGHNVVFASALSFLFRLLGALVLFILTVLVSRELGVEEAGYYFLTFAIVSVLVVISKMGFDAVILRFVGIAREQNDKEQIKQIFYKTTLAAFLVSIFIAVSFYYFSDLIVKYVFKDVELVSVFRRSAFYIPFFVITGLAAMILQGLQRTIASVMTLTISGAIVVMTALFFFEFQRAEEIVTYLVIASLISALIGVFFLRKIIFGYYSFKRKISFVTLLSTGGALWVGAVMGLMIQWSGQLVLGGYGDLAEVAFLSVAQRASMVVALILMSVNMAMAPTYAALYNKKDIDGLESLVHASLKIMMVCAFPILVVMIFFPEVVLSVFGDEYKQAKRSLQVLAVGQFVNVSTGSVGYLLTMSGHEKDFRNSVLISGSLCLVLNLILVPLYGSLGAALAIAISISLQNIVALILVKKRLNIYAFIYGFS